MKAEDIIYLRLLNQKLLASKFKTLQELTSWMGATQAQDFPMAKWALGIRSNGSTEKTISNAIDNGELIRTHLLRPTWHIASSADIYWMLELTAPQIIKKTATRHKQLELTPGMRV